MVDIFVGLVGNLCYLIEAGNDEVATVALLYLADLYPQEDLGRLAMVALEYAELARLVQPMGRQSGEEFLRVYFEALTEDFIARKATGEVLVLDKNLN